MSIVKMPVFFRLFLITVIPFLFFACYQKTETTEKSSTIKNENELDKAIILGDVLYGDWVIELVYNNGTSERIGYLVLNEKNYSVEIFPDAPIPLLLKQKFIIFSNSESGESFSLEYRDGISPKDHIDSIDNHKILVECSGIVIDEIFLIRLDKTEKTLYFHSWRSEIELIRIFKSYTD